MTKANMPGHHIFSRCGCYLLATLKEAARAALGDVLRLREGEELLIVTDFGEDAFQMARIMSDEARAMGGKVTIAVQGRKTTFDDAERLVLEAIRACPDITITMCSGLSGNDPFGYNIGYVARDGDLYDHAMFSLIDGDRRMRGLICESATSEVLRRCVAVDYGTIYENAARITKAFSRVSDVRVTTPAGTNVAFSMEGKRAYAEDGDISMPGEWSDLPVGEMRVSPVVGTANGTIVIDGTMDLITDSLIPETPVKVTIRDGFVVNVEGGNEAKMLLDAIHQGEALAKKKDLPKYEKNARNLGELGIGINPAARISGNLIEDEKVCGTAHFAIGYNYDNDAEAFIHQDCLVMHPSIWTDGKQIMRDGDFLF
jgi:aminopeptidase